MISIKFIHGLGDCANFAFSLPLYLRRGHKIEVECTADKACIFEAAGATITKKAKQVHQYLFTVTSDCVSTRA